MALSAEAAEEKGRKFFAEAEKKLSSFSMPWSKQAKFEEAAELFSKAGTQYKIAKAWDEAGKAFVKAAEASTQAQNDSESLQFYGEAAKAYRNTDPMEALRYYQIVVENFMENNKFSNAARLYKEIGEMFEAENKPAEAINAYRAAADCLLAQDQTASANQMLLKVADFSAELDDFKQAIEIYERVSVSASEKNLSAWSVKDYLFKALLCQLALDVKSGIVLGTHEALEKYLAQHTRCDGSTEFKLVADLLACVEAGDPTKFTEVLGEFHRIHRLDNWKTSILLKIKRGIKDNAVDGGDAGDVPDFT